MSCVGIITLYCNNNYGNKLQNFATKYILESLGFEVETLVCKGINSPNLKGSFVLKLYKLKKLLLEVGYRVENRKEYQIKKFDKNLNVHFITEKQVDRYSYIFLGSDQIWNPMYLDLHNREDLYRWFFLKEAHREKKIALAASIAVQSIPEEDICLFREGLRSFQYLSVRETSSANLVEAIIGNRPVVLCDPTLAVECDIWLQMCRKPQYIPNRKYVFCYFLGGIGSYKKSIEEQFPGYEIVDILDKKNKLLYTSQIEGFLWYINNAAVIMTDSFHATVFSIQFKKPFWIFPRKNTVDMSSRMVTLLKKLNFSNRYIAGKDHVDFHKNNLDFSYAESIIKEMRIDFINYIKKSTGVTYE